MDTTETKPTAATEGDWATLTQDNFSIQYPTTWELDTSREMGASFILFSPLEPEQDQFQENVNLLIQDLTGMGIDLDKFTAISEEQVKTMVTNSNLIESVRIKPASGEYHKIIYTGDLGIYHIKYEQYYWVINEKSYILTLTTELDKYDTFKETGERILNSLVFKK
jgi:hypothetical protein